MTATATRRSAFVAPTPLTDFDLGIVAYKTGKQLSACTTDEQRRGWLKQEQLGEDAYWACMMAQAERDYGPAIEDDHFWIRTGC